MSDLDYTTCLLIFCVFMKLSCCPPDTAVVKEHKYTIHDRNSGYIPSVGKSGLGSSRTHCDNLLFMGQSCQLLETESQRAGKDYTLFITEKKSKEGV